MQRLSELRVPADAPQRAHVAQRLVLVQRGRSEQVAVQGRLRVVAQLGEKGLSYWQRVHHRQVPRSEWRRRQPRVLGTEDVDIELEGWRAERDAGA